MGPLTCTRTLTAVPEGPGRFPEGHPEAYKVFVLRKWRKHSLTASPECSGRFPGSVSLNNDIAAVPEASGRFPEAWPEAFRIEKISRPVSVST